MSKWQSQLGYSHYLIGVTEMYRLDISDTMFCKVEPQGNFGKDGDRWIGWIIAKKDAVMHYCIAETSEECQHAVEGYLSKLSETISDIVREYNGE